MTDVIAGRFALCDPIAKGGSGIVWRAYDRKREQFCAAKVLRRRDAGDLLRFVREQSVRVSHPHVLAPYSWAAEDAHVVIASELVEGGSLSTLIGDYGALDLASVAAVLDQLLEALEHVHAAGLVHRDVKPANILLRATGDGPPHVMLGDFGLAVGSRDARLTEVGTVIGTPGYLAAEVLRGGAVPEPRHDLFAAGQVALALLNGAEPDGLHPRPRDPAVGSGALHDLVRALTAHDPGARPSSAAAARAACAVHTVRTGNGRHAPLRTLDNDLVEILHQLPQLSAQALHEAGADTAPAPDVTRPLVGVTQPLGIGSPRPPERAPDPELTRRVRTRLRRRGGRWIVGAAATGAVVAIAVPVAFALATSDSGGTPRSPSPASTPSTSGNSSGAGSATDRGSVAANNIRVGDGCGFLDEGNRVRAVDGRTAVCTLGVDGSYVWRAA